MVPLLSISLVRLAPSTVYYIYGAYWEGVKEQKYVIEVRLGNVVWQDNVSKKTNVTAGYFF